MACDVPKVTCKVVEIVAKYRGKPADLHCREVVPVQYICAQRYGAHVCLPVSISTPPPGDHSLAHCLEHCPSTRDAEALDEGDFDA